MVYTEGSIWSAEPGILGGEVEGPVDILFMQAAPGALRATNPDHHRMRQMAREIQETYIVDHEKGWGNGRTLWEGGEMTTFLERLPVLYTDELSGLNRRPLYNGDNRQT